MRTCNLSILLITIHLTNAYKILVLSPVPMKSHGILGDGLVRHLSGAGHEVTYVTPHKQKSRSRVKIVDVSLNKEVFYLDKFLDLDSVLKNEVVANGMLDEMHVMFAVAQATVQNPNVRKIMKEDNFDLIIAEWMYADLYAGFSAVFNCPYIWFSSIEPHFAVLRLIDVFPNPAYTSDGQTDQIPPFTFAERVEQLIRQVRAIIVGFVYIYSLESSYYEKFIIPFIRNKDGPLPSLRELTYNSSLLIGNSHVSLGTPTRLPENYKHIGGFHIDENVKPLPEDLKIVMDTAKHGVIYFSMGSAVKSKTLPDNVKENLLKMFGELDQTVIWKFEENLPNRPKNVHIVQWAPQPSILAHNNCSIFITHGGLLSLTETVHFGVPIIGIPVFADQFANVDRAVRKGFARRADLSYSLADNLREAIKDVLSNETYRTKVKELSFIYHNRPVPPGKELVHWVEHVIKTKGAPHLRSPALMMPWYQKFYLDLAALITFLILSIKYIIKILCITFKKNNSKIKIN